MKLSPDWPVVGFVGPERTHGAKTSNKSGGASRGSLLRN